MRRFKTGRIFAALLCWAAASCSGEGTGPEYSGYSTTVFMATDRHEDGTGNNLTAMLKRTVEETGVCPHTVLLGGDYVGGRGDMTPSFSIEDLYDEIYAVLDRRSAKALITYGSHDNSCIEGCAPFYSGPSRRDGYYTWGISYVQMIYATDKEASDAVEYYLEHKDEFQGPPPGAGENGQEPPKPGEGAAPPPKLGYDGIDMDDPYGISAESASKSFTSWVSNLADNDPIIVVTHVPLHVNRNDNHGALTWFDALSEAAKKHDIILFWGHNHTLEEGGNDTDRYSYLLIEGDSIDVQGDSETGAVSRTLNFTYANGGYLKLGHATAVTLSDTSKDGRLDSMELLRCSLDPADTETEFGLTGKPNPYVISLTRNRKQ